MSEPPQKSEVATFTSSPDLPSAVETIIASPDLPSTDGLLNTPTEDLASCASLPLATLSSDGDVSCTRSTHDSDDHPVLPGSSSGTSSHTD